MCQFVGALSCNIIIEIIPFSITSIESGIRDIVTRTRMFLTLCTNPGQCMLTKPVLGSPRCKVHFHKWYVNNIYPHNVQYQASPYNPVEAGEFD
jgi:hypothetical protein